jgi:hypothetical protein
MKNRRGGYMRRNRFGNEEYVAPNIYRPEVLEIEERLECIFDMLTGRIKMDKPEDELRAEYESLRPILSEAYERFIPRVPRPIDDIFAPENCFYTELQMVAISEALCAGKPHPFPELAKCLEALRKEEAKRKKRPEQCDAPEDASNN